VAISGKLMLPSFSLRLSRWGDTLRSKKKTAVREISMSDVAARCARCGNEVLVSEFIDPEALQCPNCGTKLLLDESTTAKKVSPLTVRREKPQDPQVLIKNQGPQGIGDRRTTSRRRHREGKVRKVGPVRISDFSISLFLFFTLTPILCLLRYVDFLPDVDRVDYILGGQIAFALFYAVILVEAFNEEMFDGMLCLFVPLYAFFYLFFKSTSFSLRAVVASLTAAFGYDVALTVYAWTIAAFVNVSSWINGGALR
jgi:DNA-directed RNA polymerase subunit RPC12/RpoP